MARLTVLMGAPGAGKTTWARSVRDGKTPGEIVSTEEARVDPSAGEEVMRAAYRRMDELLAAGQDVVFDTTGATSNIRKAALGIAKRHGAEAELHIFDTPVETCVAAQRGRKHPVPEAKVRRYHADIQRQMPGLKDEGFASVRVTRRSVTRT